MKGNIFTVFIIIMYRICLNCIKLFNCFSFQNALQCTKSNVKFPKKFGVTPPEPPFTAVTQTCKSYATGLTNVLLGSPHMGKLLGVPIITNSTGEEQAKATFELATQWSISNNVRAPIFDTTASNSG